MSHSAHHSPTLPQIINVHPRISDIISPREEYSPAEIAVLLHTKAYRRELLYLVQLMDSFNPIKAPWKAVALYLWLHEFFLPLLHHSERVKVDVIMPYFDELGYHIPTSLNYTKARPRFLEETYAHIHRIAYRLYILAISEEFPVMPVEETSSLVQDLQREVQSIYHDLMYHYDEEERCLVYLLTKEGVDWWHRALCIDEKTGFEKRKYQAYKFARTQSQQYSPGRHCTNSNSSTSSNHNRNNNNNIHNLTINTNQHFTDDADQLFAKQTNCLNEDIKTLHRQLRIGCIFYAAGLRSANCLTASKTEAVHMMDAHWCPQKYLSSLTHIFSWYSRNYKLHGYVQQYCVYHKLMQTLLSPDELLQVPPSSPVQQNNSTVTQYTATGTSSSKKSFYQHQTHSNKNSNSNNSLLTSKDVVLNSNNSSKKQKMVRHFLLQHYSFANPYLSSLTVTHNAHHLHHQQLRQPHNIHNKKEMNNARNKNGSFWGLCTGKQSIDIVARSVYEGESNANNNNNMNHNEQELFSKPNFHVKTSPKAFIASNHSTPKSSPKHGQLHSKSPPKIVPVMTDADTIDYLATNNNNITNNSNNNSNNNMNNTLNNNSNNYSGKVLLFPNINHNSTSMKMNQNTNSMSSSSKKTLPSSLSPTNAGFSSAKSDCFSE